MDAADRQFDLIVLGAGAAGLMCAATAGERGRRVALLDHNAQPGKKILVSGGGRCNFTNLHCGPQNFLSENSHFAKSALALYQPRHFLDLVERYGIKWHEKTLGQLFCDGSSRAILDMLLAECARHKVEVILNAREIAVEPSPGGGFCIASSQGKFHAESLVVATGGLSIPKLGATGLGYEIARQFGLRVIEPHPALVPLLLGGVEASWTELAGVATEVTAWIESKREPKRKTIPTKTRDTKPQLFREMLLVTHRGLSGPAVLQASSYWHQGAELVVDFSPALAAGEELLAALRAPDARRDSSALKQLLRTVLPHRLANYLADSNAPQGWSNPALSACERQLRQWRFHPTGSEGFAKAEVTAGGIDTNDLQARTMEARTVPGLFFIGEVVDVTGQLGGFNFQWAWSSAVAAGRAV
jgi:hypothetical protein